MDNLKNMVNSLFMYLYPQVKMVNFKTCLKYFWFITGKNKQLTLIYFHDVPASTYENITHGELVVKKLIFYNILDKKYIIVYEYTIKKKPKK